MQVLTCHLFIKHSHSSLMDSSFMEPCGTDMEPSTWSHVWSGCITGRKRCLLFQSSRIQLSAHDMSRAPCCTCTCTSSVSTERSWACRRMSCNCWYPRPMEVNTRTVMANNIRPAHKQTSLIVWVWANTAEIGASKLDISNRVLRRGASKIRRGEIPFASSSLISAGVYLKEDMMFVYGVRQWRLTDLLEPSTRH